MLFRLRHPAVISCDNEQREIDRADARNHVLDEILVPWHIHDPDIEQRIRRAQFKMCKAQFDRDAAQFFFWQAIWIGACERVDERALAVIDVSSCGEDKPLQLHCPVARSTLTTCASCFAKIVRRSSLNFPPAM